MNDHQGLTPPISCGPRLSRPGAALLLVLLAGGAYYLAKHEAGRPEKAAALPNLVVPPGKKITAAPVRGSEPVARRQAPAAPPSAASRARAEDLIDEIHELSRQAAAAQDEETGNLPLIRRLEGFHRSVGSLRSAYRSAGGEALDAKSRRAQLEILLLDAREIDSRAAALSTTASLHWQAIGRRLRDLRPHF